MRRFQTVMAALLFVATLSGIAHAQGIVVSHHDHQRLRDFFAVTREEVRVAIDDQYARTSINQWVKNISQENAEAVWLFPVPENAAVGPMELFLGETKLTGEIKPAKEARDIYNDIVRRKRDPALLEFVGTGVYRTSVFPFRRGEEKLLRLSYGELLAKEGGMIRYLLPLSNAKFSKYPIEQMRVVIDIASERPIRNIYSPSHEIAVTRAGDRRAQVLWSASGAVAPYDLELFVSFESDDLGTSLLSFKGEGSQDGFFLFLASPGKDIETGVVEPKDVVFIVDRSGSMAADRKLDQARSALLHCLKDLNPEDCFDILAFGNDVDEYAPRLVPIAEGEKTKAAMYLNGVVPSGGTNIGKAVGRAFALLNGRQRPGFILLLTDGLPTVGETDVKAILAGASATKRNNVRLFAFGVGYDVNTTLLDKLAEDHRGIADYVEPGERIEGKLARFSAKIRNPVLTDLRFAVSGLAVYDLFPQDIPDLCAGDQIVLCGRYRGDGPVRISLSGKSRGKEIVRLIDGRFRSASESNEGFSFIERLWASKQIGFLIDQIRFHGKNKELTDEIVRLSMKYGIVTEYTSFLIREDVVAQNRAANDDRARKEINERLDVRSGLHGVKQSRNIAKMRQGNLANQNDWYFDERGERVEIAGVQNVGGRVFMKEGGVWNDTTVPPEATGEEIRYFSDEFFKLLAEHPELNRAAAIGEALNVQIREKTYALR